MTCPIAGYRIDEKAARVVAGFVLLGTLLGLFLPAAGARGVFLFLALDFATRGFSRPRWSPLGRLAGLILRALSIAAAPVDAGPKRFAARIGLAFSLSLLALAGTAAPTATFFVGGVLAFCAALESFVGVCLGCRAWTLWYDVLDRFRQPSASSREA